MPRDSGTLSRKTLVVDVRLTPMSSNAARKVGPNDPGSATW